MRGADSATRSTVVNGHCTLHAAPGQSLELVNRSLYAGMTSHLHSPLWLETRGNAEFPSRIDVGSASEFVVESGAALKVFPLGSGGFVNIARVFRIVASSMAFDTEASLTVVNSSGGLIDVGDRTVNFAPGAGINLSGRLVLHGGRIPLTPPADPNGTNGGTIAVRDGSIDGHGEIGFARVGFVPVGGLVSESSVSGQLTFGELHLEPTATYAVTINGRSPGQFDHLVVEDKLRLSGALSVALAQGVAEGILASDIFEIVTTSPGCDALGEFANVPFGQRIESIGGAGSFLVDHAAPGSSSIVLRDFKGIPFRLSGLDGAIHYSPYLQMDTGLNESGPVAVAPQAALTAFPDLNWNGVSLRVEVIDGWDEAQDILAARGLGISLAGDRVHFSSANGPVDIGGWTVSGSQLQFVFNADASVDSVQALMRSVVYFNRACLLEAFVTGAERFAPRIAKMTLADGAGYKVVHDVVIDFPHPVGILFDPPTAYMHQRSQGYARLVSDFSDGQLYELPRLDVVVTPAPDPFFSGRFFAQLDSADHSFVRIYSGLTQVDTVHEVEAQNGLFAARMCVSIIDDVDCTFSLLAGHGFEPCTPLPAALPPAIQPADATPPVSLPVFHALEALMNQTEEGRRLVGLYWQHTVEVVGILTKNRDLLDQAIGVVASFQPAVQSLLSGNGGGVQITSAMINQLNSVWSTVAAYASPALQTALLAERGRFNGFQDFAGRNFSQWSGMLQLQNPSDPWVYLSKVRVEEGQVRVEVNEVSGRALVLLRSADLSHWMVVPGALTQADGFTVRLVDPAPVSSEPFYRIRVE